MTPCARSMAWLRRQGYTVARVEHWNPWAHRRVDLFGFADLVGLHPRQPGVLAVQATTDTHSTSHLATARQSKELALWLKTGNRFSLHLWAKRGARGRRKMWRLRPLAWPRKKSA